MKKQLKELTIKDNFMFGAVMTMPENCKDFLEMVLQAADRIFGILPSDQGSYFREIWEEFEAYETGDAKYAHLLDNFQPLLLNHVSGGKSWAEHGVKRSQIYKRNKKMEETSKTVWECVKAIVEENIEKGNVKAE